MTGAVPLGLWDTFRSRVVVTAELVCETALRVGAGTESFLPTATDLPVVTVDGRPYIPGSSLRGVLRSHLERIVRSLEPKAGGGFGACDPLSEGARCMSNTIMDSYRQQAKKYGEAWLAERIWTDSCRICRVFGSPWLASRVRVADLLCLNGALPEVRDGVAINREKEAVQNKFDFEVVPPGSLFGLELVAENLGQDELGLLLLGVKELEAGRIALGGFKGRGLGRVSLRNLHINYVSTEDRQALRRYLLTGEMLEASAQEVDGWVAAFVERCGGGADA
ncbi:MAG: type III CRISPR-associated RAMP protein Csx7 [Moorellales bacterium]